MKVQQIAFGERYGDDSGWERYVAIDAHECRCTIDIGGGTMTISLSEVPWLLQALGAAYDHYMKDVR